jgi:hypothetical protein
MAASFGAVVNRIVEFLPAARQTDYDKLIL